MIKFKNDCNEQQTVKPIGCSVSSLVPWLVSVVCLAPELAVMNSALPLEGESVSFLPSLEMLIFTGDCRTLDTEAFVWKEKQDININASAVIILMQK